jgi:hypothetical protein
MISYARLRHYPARPYLVEECLRSGPIDVWLADNQWFGLILQDCRGGMEECRRKLRRTPRGQHRGRGTKSDIVQSSELKYSK